MSNNTTGASIYDLGNIIKAESISEVSHILKANEEKQMRQRQEEMQQQQQMQEQALQAKQQEEMMKIQFEQGENDKERQKDLLVAQIRAAGYGSMQDINQNQQSDYQDALADIRKSDEFQQQMDLKKESNSIKQAQSQDMLNLKREELATKREIANKQLEVARTNKNKYDVKTPKNKEE